MARKAGTISVDLEMKTAAFIQNTQKATAVLNSNVAQMKRSLNSIQQTAGLVQGAIAAWAGSQAVGAIKQVVTEFGEAQKSVVSLNGALAATGRYSEESSQKIQDMAASMQQMTTADGDALVQASATFAQFAKELSGNEIANAQQAIIGLATVMKIDLNTAAMQVGKAVAGATDTIGRSGIKISEVKNQHERLNDVLQKTASFYEQAKSDASSFQGRSIQLNNAVGDLRETVGLLTLSLAGGTTGLQNITKMVIYFTNQLANSIPKIIDWKMHLIQAMNLGTWAQPGVGGLLAPLLNKIKIGNTNSSVGSLMKTYFTIQSALDKKAAKDLQMPPPQLDFSPPSFSLGSGSQSTKNGNRKSGGGKSSAEKEMDRLKQAAIELKAGLKDIWTKEADDIANATKLLEKHLITIQDHIDYVRNAERAAHDAFKVEGVKEAVDSLVAPHKKFLDDFDTSLKETNSAYDEGAQLIKALQTPQEELAGRLEYLNDLFNYGAINLTTLNRATEEANKKYQEATKGSNQFAQSVQNVVSQFGDQFFNTVIQGAKNGQVAFRDFISSALLDLGRLIFKLTVTIPLANALSNALGGNKSGKGAVSGAVGSAVSSGIFSGIKKIFGFADGGFPPVGMPSLVGERGPELFIPKTAGMIVPNHALGGGQSVVVYQTIQISTGVVPTVQAEIARMLPEISKQTQKDVRAAIGRGGQMAKSVGLTT